jgi:hypothetical protein
MSRVQPVFIGTEAVARGDLTYRQLARSYQLIYPNVYAHKLRELSVRDRTIAAYLWSKRRGVIAGAAASELHGARWVDAQTDTEVVCPTTRPPKGLICRRDTLTPSEITRVAGIPVTSLARTAYDLGRLLPRDVAVQRLDALKRATPFVDEKVLRLASEHPRVSGIQALRDVLPLVDGGSASPKETWLRLLLIDAGLPRPTTQIPFYLSASKLGAVDMGWQEFLVAAEYDGQEHQTDRERYVNDRRRLRRLNQLGWLVVTVIKEDRPDDVIQSVRRALLSRGWRP